ncbi:MAG: exopolysaccharide biosynthesis polyprenyl glycosylphosphotransferase [Ruminococcaceae bacterium]|nr:exopolysaccharide biosynthesis polyprenyl glycosylphosphotransferase [Oscillospiraceae bacterium]
MFQTFKRTYLLACQAACFLINLAIFLVLFSINNDHLLRPSRTAAITVLTFFFVYVLTTRVYGSFDIGAKKSKPIIYSLSLCLFTADLIAHLFLSIMNITVIHDGQFVYEQPWMLVLVFVAQVAVTSLLTYGCNHLYFTFIPQQKCLLICHRTDNIKKLKKSIDSYRKQFVVCREMDLNDPQLLSAIDENDCIFLCNLTATERVHIVEYCYAKRKNIYYTLEVSDFVSLGARRIMFSDTSMMHCPPKGLHMEQRIIKRGFDILVSAFVLLLTSPIFLLTAIAIKLEDGGHVFYRQPRATYGGRVFNVIKFRSMREANSVNVSVTKNDDRITKVGKFIRKFRIDELPQLINVLKGDMTLVGPRPEMLENVEKYTCQLPEFSYRLWVKAGLTGMAQIYGKYNTSPKEKLALDIAYIEQYSLLLDLRLFLRTLLVLFTPEESTEAFDDEAEELQL